MKPRVVFLLVLSAVAGYFTGATVTGSIDWFKVFLVIFAGYLSSGGANAVNSWFDRDIDKIMYRTKQRPIPEHKISANSAILWAIISIILGVGLAYFTLNPLSALMMLIGAIWYSIFYTMILKRRTRWNIIWGGLAGTFPVYAGWAAATNSLSYYFPWLIGLTVWIWIPLHFWALAIRLRKEYEEVNVPMLPVVIGVEKTVPYIATAGILLSLVVTLLIFIETTSFLYLILVTPLTLWMLKYTLNVIRQPTEENSWSLFKVSNIYLVLVDFILILDAILFVLLKIPAFGYFNII